MPPLPGYTRVTGRRVVPYENEALKLSNNLWLAETGEVTTVKPLLECGLTPETLEYWEETAARGGNVLADLIV